MGSLNRTGKCIVTVFNLLLFLAGLIPFTVGIIAITNDALLAKTIGYLPVGAHNISALFTDGVIYFIIIGAIIASIGFLGCFGACCESKLMLKLHIVLLVAVVLAEVAVIIIVVGFPEKFNKGGEKLMRDSLEGYTKDCQVDNATTNVANCSQDRVTLAWDTLQYEFRCCGASSLNDYANGTAPAFEPRFPGALAPLTCCSHEYKRKFDPTNIPNDNSECLFNGQNASTYFATGCFKALLHWVIKSPIVISVMAGIGVLELILIVLTSVLLRSEISENEY